MIRRGALWVGPFIFSLALPASAERLWLVVGASATSAEEIIQKTKLHNPRTPDSFIIQTHDCGDKKNLFAWVAKIAPSADAARAALAQLRTTVKDAYVKSCKVKANSLLALRITVIDNSIADLPSDAVNWEDEDRVSSAHLLPDGSVLVIIRHYQEAQDNPLNGRSERPVWVRSPNTRVTLEENCIGPDRAVIAHERIAFQCVTEQTPNALLRSVFVFNANGEKIMEIERCQNPKWVNETTVACYEESVGSDAELKLAKERTEFKLKK